MIKFNFFSKVRSFFNHHKIVITSIAVVIIFFLFFVLYDAATTPPSQVSVYKMKPTNLGGPSFIYNGTSYPYIVNVTGSSFTATFEAMHAIQIFLEPGQCGSDGFEISLLSDKAINPYSNVTFFVSSANLTIGNYTTDLYHFSCGGTKYPLGIVFAINGTHIIQYDQPNLSYHGKFSVTLTPVLHYGVFYFIQNEITINYTTQHPWIYIDEVNQSANDRE